MKVYVITKGEYSDYHICSVCLDKEEAERRLKLFSSDWEDAMIEEYDTDVANEYEKLGDKIVRVDGRKKWIVRVYNGMTNIISSEIDEFDVGSDNMMNTPSCSSYGAWSVRVFAHSEEEAKKIAYDKIAEEKYKRSVEQEG